MSFINHYEILQVSPNAETSVIEAAAKALLKQNHPDVGGRATLTREFIEAKNVLTDPDRRKQFDAELRAKLQNTIGPYRVVKKLAEGGFGRVYEAVHTLIDERVCIKHSINISDKDKAMFIQEAKAIWDLRHHSLPSIRDVLVLDDGSIALIMTFIKGPTLYDLVEEYRAKGKVIDPENICWLLDRVLDALRYMHWHGVVHGDVKPQNILVQRKQHTCALVDFGLSKIKPDRTDKANGYTPAFASPEQLKLKPLLPESDLYSLGLTFIYAVGGDPTKRRVPQDLPKPLQDFLGKLVIYDISKRPHWQNTDLVEELRQVRLEVFGREHTNFKEI